MGIYTPIKYLMTFHIKTIQHNTMQDQTICMLPRSGVDRHTVQCDVTYDRPAEPYHYHRETLAATAAALI